VLVGILMGEVVRVLGWGFELLDAQGLEVVLNSWRRLVDVLSGACRNRVL
jgi:hypothetical protein